MNQLLTCFKSYDIRGRLGTELDEGVAYRIGRAYAQFLGAKRVVVGCDIRQSSEGIKAALADGIQDAGCDVIDLGMTGTEEIYFSTFHLDVDGGVEITASHNPADFNGMKLVRRGAIPISGDTGLRAIQALAEANDFPPILKRGGLSRFSCLDEYVAHLLTYIVPGSLKPMRLVVNAGNGAAGHVIDAIENRLLSLGVPWEFIKIHHDPDGAFPNGIPNPLLPENRETTAEAVRLHSADLGIAWDGDFDRCFLFDEQGRFIEGYYIVGLLAEAFLKKSPNAKIIHDPRLVWNTQHICQKFGGHAVQSKTGHAFIKERMRQEDAVYGGEMSAHHYFREFAYCDSGMIPWLLVAELMGNQRQPLSALVDSCIREYPCSGEINFSVHNTVAIMDAFVTHFSAQKPRIDRTDGLSFEFDDWRMNVRSSNTEPLLRLNIESRGSEALVMKQLEVARSLIQAQLDADAGRFDV